MLGNSDFNIQAQSIFSLLKARRSCRDAEEELVASLTDAILYISGEGLNSQWPAAKSRVRQYREEDLRAAREAFRATRGAIHDVQDREGTP